MSSNYNRKVEYVIYWLGSGNEMELSRLERLRDNQISVSSFSDSTLLQQNIAQKVPDLLVITGYSTPQECIDLGLTIKSNNQNTHMTLMLISEFLDKETKEYYYQSGGNELIIEPASLTEIYFRISHLKYVFDDKNNSSIQIEEASQMALLAMENSSDLGATIDFVKSAARCHTYESMANSILDAVKIYSDSAIVEMVGAQSFYYYGSDGSVDPDLKKLMLQNKSKERIVRFDNAFQINHSNLVILAEGLPIDDIPRMGRIADNLAILADTADRFVSELLAHERAVSTELTKRRFISTISHELNTPMNAVQGFSNIFSNKNEGDCLSNKDVVALKSIYTNSEKMKTIIETLIDITGDAEGASLLSEDDIDLNNLVFHINNDFSALATEKNLTLIFPEKLDIQFKGDQKHIRKMLSHLVDNAIKFTEVGSVEFIVKKIDHPRLGAVIRLCIRDTGIGISESDLERLFKQIGQLDISHDRKRYGAGLGLCYVQNFANQLNGKIEANSVLGEGSEFILTLPLSM